MRIEFKKPNKQNNFIKFCKENGANYFEDDCGIWIIPKKCGEYFASIRLDEDGMWKPGKIDEDCNNFEACDGRYLNKEVDWIIETLKIIKKWKI